MSTFNRLETAALKAMADAVPNHRDALLARFQSATVTKRENTGAGFFTDFTVDCTAFAPLPLTVSDMGAVAEIEGFGAPFLLMVFWKDGHPVMLEGASCGDDTSAVDFGTIGFKLT